MVVTLLHEQDAALVRKRHVSGTHFSGMTLAGVSILTFTVIGVLVNDDFGWAVGFIIGVVIGTIVACCVPSPTRGTATGFLPVAQYRRVRKLLWWLGCVVLVWVVGGVVLLTAGQCEPSFWLLALWAIIPTFVVRVVGHSFGRQLDDLHCPTCDSPFPRRGCLANYPDVCIHCGFAIHSDRIELGIPEPEERGAQHEHGRKAESP